MLRWKADRILELATGGGSTFPNITKPQLEELPVPGFSLQEQRAKEATKKVIAATRQLKASLMKHLFTYGSVPFDQADRVPLKETDAGRLPQHWRVACLKEVLREPLRNGHSAKVSNTNEGIRTLTLTAVTQNDFSIKNTKLTSADAHRVRHMWLKREDIFVERANTPEYVGLVALYRGEDNFAIFPDLLVRVRVNESQVDPKFLAEFLLMPACRSYFRMNAKKTAGNFPKIDQGTIENTRIPVPLLSNQQHVAAQLTTVDAKLTAEERRREALDALFNSLLHHLMTGKVRVGDVAL